MYKLKYGAFGAITLISINFVLNFLVTFGDWIPVPRGKQVNFDSGVAGSLRGALKGMAGKRLAGKISVERNLVSDDIKKEKRVGGIHFLFDWLTFGNVTIWVVGEEWQWEEVPANRCDNKNGAIRFRGNLEGKLLHTNPDEMAIIKELQLQTETNRYLVGSLEEIEAQAANMASKQYIDIDAATQLGAVISDRMKNIRIMMKGRGGGEVEAMASEMS